MAEVQDEDQWLYGGDGKEDSGPKEDDAQSKEPAPEECIEKSEKEAQETSEKNEGAETEAAEDQQTDGASPPSKENKELEGETDGTQEGKKDEDQTEGEPKDEETAIKKTEDDDSSSDDEPTVTIGKIVKQPDILRAPQPTHRAAPTTGPKDEDFDSIGKINDVPITDFNLNEFEDKPWRKPGADLSDYFNYGFTEETWIRYCERQKTLRVQEAQIGLVGLGSAHKVHAISSVPVNITTNESKYMNGRGSKAHDSEDANQVNTIQVMTAEKRTYSSKVLNTFENDFSTPPPYGNFYNRPPPTAPMYSAPPPFDSSQGQWPLPNVPPPGWNPDSGPPPSSSGPYYEESHGRERERSPDRERERDRTVERERDRERDRTVDRERESDSHRTRDRESRYHRRRSRSRSKTRHRKRSRSRSRSRSPSHRRKHKKSKREAE